MGTTIESLYKYLRNCEEGNFQLPVFGRQTKTDWNHLSDDRLIPVSLYCAERSYPVFPRYRRLTKRSSEPDLLTRWYLIQTDVTSVLGHFFGFDQLRLYNVPLIGSVVLLSPLSVGVGQGQGTTRWKSGIEWHRVLTLVVGLERV